MRPLLNKALLIGLLLGAGVAQAQIAPRPLYRDPVYDAASDPVIIYNKARKQYEMFYTQRRAGIPLKSDKDVSWVHGTKIGYAISHDMAKWQYAGVLDLPAECAAITQWAPEIIYDNGLYHMFLTNVAGIYENWNAGRYITHLTSKDLRHWDCADKLDLKSDRVIDAAILKLGKNQYNLFYKDERQGSKIFRATSSNLKDWQITGKISEISGEGPKPFKFGGKYWLIYDSWKGLEVLTSQDGKDFIRLQEPILASAGTQKTDRAKGQHPDVYVKNNRAFLIYFVSQYGEDEAVQNKAYGQKSVIQINELRVKKTAKGDILEINRDENLDLKGLFK